MRTGGGDPHPAQVAVVPARCEQGRQGELIHRARAASWCWQYSRQPCASGRTRQAPHGGRDCLSRSFRCDIARAALDGQQPIPAGSQSPLWQNLIERVCRP